MIVTTEMWIIRKAFSEEYYNGQAIPSLVTDMFTGEEIENVDNTWTPKLVIATRFDNAEVAARIANLLITQSIIDLEVKRVKVIRKA